MTRVKIETADGRSVEIEDGQATAKRLCRLAVDALDEVGPEVREPAGFKVPPRGLSASSVMLDEATAWQRKLIDEPVTSPGRTGRGA